MIHLQREREIKSENPNNTEKDSFYPRDWETLKGPQCHVANYSQGLRSLSSRSDWAESEGWAKKSVMPPPRADEFSVSS